MQSKIKQTMLVLGGCRSGKSRFAEEWIAENFKQKTYVATSVVGSDKEMQRRVDLHKERRKGEWLDVEEPLEIASVLRKASVNDGVCLVDCLTLWLTNLLLADLSDCQIEERIRELGKAVDECLASVVLVSNEVGLGIVPESRLSRRFRDLAGWCNQQIGRHCSKVVFVAAGLPLYLKK
ncbi:MAG: bifunctional adenosylcobinamide kinase/adenosylcobinamide-phosphate guanylyltransferase [Desulfobulbaceae bacterium]|nr:bifunctional adenosylcobinamide kinase/adenosylcobinamide-phosphate guanylyltransferase [Desulfobulbaceae bacterium]